MQKPPKIQLLLFKGPNNNYIFNLVILLKIVTLFKSRLWTCNKAQGISTYKQLLLQPLNS